MVLYLQEKSYLKRDLAAQGVAECQVGFGFLCLCPAGLGLLGDTVVKRGSDEGQGHRLSWRAKGQGVSLRKKVRYFPAGTENEQTKQVTT